ncbi:hypothetical protein ACA910_017807 [Epithemia clementina (nom. ined.)]
MLFASNDDSKIQDNDERNSRQGVLILLTVPVAWATYEPAVRYVYALDHPVPGFLFSFSYFLVASIALVLLTAWTSHTTTTTSAVNTTSLDNLLPSSYQKWPTKEGVELGIYLFIGNSLQLLGLQTVPADKAAFLLQIKAILVPILEALFARRLGSVSVKNWLACLLVLVGVALMELPTNIIFQGFTTGSGHTFFELGTGEVYIFAAAAIYSLHILRLGTHARKDISALKLAAAKALTECFCALMSVVALTSWASSITANSNVALGKNELLVLAQEQGSAMNEFFLALASNESTTNSKNVLQALQALGATVWTGLITIAYTIYAQTVGQRTVSAVTANLIYMIQPICTAAFAWLLLGETLGLQGYVGAAIITAAVLIGKS